MAKTPEKKSKKSLGKKDMKKTKGGLTCRKAGGTQQEYLKVEMKDAFISG